eukprot:CAMPEP_0175983782 /NCGR_PEP_ID=MMETSP0108-20121206/48645_1 /TAXON_ID=195067 ORGANISM="Goniomonas pacifica, Strain CCMP1869" /NCGR_SAMPLE_ID=MMETSP0108 /ASSEMBLY_ACC=CAM_ASM_000204 /LENGTH=123 /DNA_ID=CAMNT_0017314587 /DNA_START=427 /DNA_END=798 /DNA_ORIENTATION=+
MVTIPSKVNVLAEHSVFDDATNGPPELLGVLIRELLHHAHKVKKIAIADEMLREPRVDKDECARGDANDNVTSHSWQTRDLCLVEEDTMGPLTQLMQDAKLGFDEEDELGGAMRCVLRNHIHR